MAEDPAATPRWGNQRRDRKAAAIRDTLCSLAGADIAGGRWLDVGCGSGGIAATLAGGVAHVTGIDPEPWPEWREAMEACGNLALIAGRFDGDTLPVPEASMDVVVCNQVYEHVADPARLVENLHRVMKPGAVCYFAGPNLLWPVEPHVFWPFVHWLPRRSAQALMRALGSRRADELDAHSTTSWTLRRRFRTSGLDAQSAVRERLVAELRLRGAPGLARLAAGTPRWMHRLLEPVVPGFIFVLRKPAP